MSGPLDGVRVLDLTHVVMGPYATQLMADQGADVIMIESPTGLDANRVLGGGPHEQLAGMALNILRNKRSVALDLKSDAGRAAMRKLIATADVLLAALRPSALERLGLDYESVRAIKPDLIYCQAQGFPMDSAQRDAAAYDDVIQAASGMTSLTQRAFGKRSLVPTVVADKVSGVKIAQAVSAALFQRERTGQGTHIEVAMTRATTAFLLVEHATLGITEPPMGDWGYQRILMPAREPHKTSDGYLHVLPYTPKNYDDLFGTVDWPELRDRSRYETHGAMSTNGDTLYPDISRVLATRSTAEWMQFCTEHSIPAAEVRALEDLIAEFPIEQHPVVGGYRVIESGARFNGERTVVRRHAPLLGEHTEEILASLD
ncbi:MAG: CaiB/BaiF CoA transferase family protein [Cumulibacter sp.]